MNNHLTPNEILLRVCAEYGLTPEDLASPTRKSEISQARQMLCYILLFKLDIPVKEISVMLGGRTTAAYLAEEGRSKIKRYLRDAEIYKKVWLTE